MPPDDRADFEVEFRAAVETVILSADALRVLRNIELSDDVPLDKKPSEEVRMETSRAYFAAWESLFNKYRAARNWPTDQGPLNPLPRSLLWQIEGMFGMLAVGDMSGPVSDVGSQGRKGPATLERQDISVAVAYVAAAKAGKISDRAPVKTIAEKYGVTRRTVQGWCKSFAAIDLPSRDGDEYRMLTALMQEAGARYLVAGRSIEALKARDPRIKAADAPSATN